MTEMKHLQKSEINQVRILAYDRDETFTKIGDQSSQNFSVRLRQNIYQESIMI